MKELVLSQVEIEPQYSDETENSITIYGLKFILEFLRIFGCCVKNLRFFSYIMNRKGRLT